MAGLNYTTALWPLGPYTLGAGQSGEWVITYPGGGSLVSFNAVWPWDYGVQFNLETTGVIVNGSTEDAPPDNTQYFVTVTNESDSPGQFAFILEAIYF
jgi:hypothetical protein